MRFLCWSLIIIWLIGCQTTNNVASQSYWSDIQPTTDSFKEYRSLSLTLNDLKNSASKDGEISVPLPEGEFINVKIKESATMSPELAKKYPEIKSYIVTKSANIISGRIDINPSGFYAMITTDTSTFFINPVNKGSKDYLCYDKINAKRDMNNPFVDKVLKP
jgi:hypothetical protein